MNLDFEIKEFNKSKYQEIKQNWDRIAKPIDGMGKFEEIICQIGAIQNKEKPNTQKKAILIFCADNGIVEEGISQSSQEVTRICAQNIAQGKTTVGIMAKQANASVYSIDVGINYDKEIPEVIDYKIRQGTRNFLKEPAMTREEVTKAINVGITNAAKYRDLGYSILAIGEMGIGNTTTTSAVAAGLLNLSAKMVTGRGAGLDDEGLKRKQKVVDTAIQKYDLYNKDAFEILRHVGGFDIAAMTGVCIGAAKYQIPVVLDGVISQVAALLAKRMCPAVKDYLIASHISREPVSLAICKELELEPVLDANMALGEGTGAALMLSLIDTANRIYLESVPFSDSGVEQYSRF